MDVTAAKTALRASIRAHRRDRAEHRTEIERLAVAERLAGAALDALDSAAPGWDSPGSAVAVYRASAAEPPTGALCLALAERGVRVLVPRTRADLDLEWHELHVGVNDAGREAVLSAVPMPRRPSADGEAAAGPVDEGPSLGLEALSSVAAVLTPGLAVDVAGHRLGQGGGCYDRALRRRAPGVPAITVVFDDELVQEVPHDTHDSPVDGVVTPTRGWTPLPARGLRLGE